MGSTSGAKARDHRFHALDAVKLVPVLTSPRRLPIDSCVDVPGRHPKDWHGADGQTTSTRPGRMRLLK